MARWITTDAHREFAIRCHIFYSVAVGHTDLCIAGVRSTGSAIGDFLSGAPALPKDSCGSGRRDRGSCDWVPDRRGFTELSRRKQGFCGHGGQLSSGPGVSEARAIICLEPVGWSCRPGVVLSGCRPDSLEADGYWCDYAAVATGNAAGVCGRSLALVLAFL